MMPYKRPAADKSGVPVYQPNATTYQQLMQLQQPFVPVSCEYSSSPTSTSATTSVSPPCVTAEPQLVPVTATSQLSSQITRSTTPKDSTEVVATSRPASTPAAALPPPAIPDPAALAKEVAQHNYAKAVKLAAANQSLAAVNPLNPLNPLNYTGVALNKQTMSIPPPTFARYPATALPLGLGTTGLSFGIGNPYGAPSNFLNVARPVLNPYNHLVRASYTNSQQFLSPGLLSAAQYPATVASTPITTVAAATAAAAAAAVQSNNNNNTVNLQPYKKLKTT